MERSDRITNYGNRFTTIITDKQLADYCNEYVVVTEWVVFNDTNWLELGTMTGAIAVTCEYGEISHRAYQMNDEYREFKKGSVTIGSSYTYTIHDSNRDRTCILYK